MSNTAHVNPNTLSGLVFDRLQTVCYVKMRWSDPWMYYPYLEPLNSAEVAAPAISSASFLWHYGEIKREDQNVFQTITPRTLDGLFVQIRGLQANGQAPLWTGVIHEENNIIQGGVKGIQGYTAYGLEHLLDRESVLGAVFEEGGVAKNILRCPVFNQKQRYGLKDFGNRSALPVETPNGTCHVFSSAGEKWTNLQVAIYVLTQYKPTGVPFVIMGQTDPLDHIILEQRLEGLSPWQALTHLIDRNRGLGFKVMQPGMADNESVVIWVYSLLGSSVLVDGYEWPANAWRIDSMDLASNILLNDPEVMRSSTLKYDRVVVQGEPIRVCFTASVADGSLEPGWTSEEEAAYVLGDPTASDDPDACDRERQTDKFERVYQVLRLTKGWEWEVSNPETELVYSASPGVASDGSLITDFVAAVWERDKSFMRYLPFPKTALAVEAEPEYQSPLVVMTNTEGKYVQVDAANADGSTPATVSMCDRELAIKLTPKINHILGLGHFGGPNVILDRGFDSPSAWQISGPASVSGGRLNITGTGTSTITQTPPASASAGVQVRLSITTGGGFDGVVTLVFGEAGTQPFSGVGLLSEVVTTTSTSGLSILVDSASQGWLDNISVREVTGIETNSEPEFDYETIQATVFVETDTRLTVIEEAARFPVENAKVLYLDVQGAQVWYMIPGTVTGVTNGALVRDPLGGILRDDSPTLRSIASLAMAWYGQRRSELRVPYKALVYMPAVGTYINYVTQGTRTIEVGTTVTSVTYDYRGQKSSFETGYCDIELLAGIEFPGMSDIRAFTREVRRVRGEQERIGEHVGNLPVRFASGGGSGMAQTQLYTLTEFPLYPFWTGNYSS